MQKYPIINASVGFGLKLDRHSDGSFRTTKGFLCRVLPWNWSKYKVSYSQGTLIAYTAGSPDPSDDDFYVNNPLNQISPGKEKIVTWSLNLTRYYKSNIFLLDFGGIAVSFIDFTATNRLERRKYSSKTNTFQKSGTIDLRFLGIGSKFCYISYVEESSPTLDICHYLLLGVTDLTMEDESFETHQEQFFAYSSGLKLNIGFRFDNTYGSLEGFSLNFGITTSDFRKRLHPFNTPFFPEKCKDCPHKIELREESISLGVILEF